MSLGKGVADTAAATFHSGRMGAQQKEDGMLVHHFPRTPGTVRARFTSEA